MPQATTEENTLKLQPGPIEGESGRGKRCNDLGADHAPGWGRMSSLLIPATTTGFVIASRRNGSPNSWFITTSMKVVTPSSICSFTAVRSASVSRKTGHHLTRHTSAGLLGAHPVMPDLRH